MKKALTWEEFNNLVANSNGGVHIWVKFLEFEDEDAGIFAAIADHHFELGPCAVWCTDSNEKPLTKETYGTEWVAWVDMERLTNLEED